MCVYFPIMCINWWYVHIVRPLEHSSLISLHFIIFISFFWSSLRITKLCQDRFMFFNYLTFRFINLCLLTIPTIQLCHFVRLYYCMHEAARPGLAQQPTLEPNQFQTCAVNKQSVSSHLILNYSIHLWHRSAICITNVYIKSMLGTRNGFCTIPSFENLRLDFNIHKSFLLCL